MTRISAQSISPELLMMAKAAITEDGVSRRELLSMTETAAKNGELSDSERLFLSSLSDPEVQAQLQKMDLDINQYQSYELVESIDFKGDGKNIEVEGKSRSLDLNADAVSYQGRLRGLFIDRPHASQKMFNIFRDTLNANGKENYDPQVLKQTMAEKLPAVEMQYLESLGLFESEFIQDVEQAYTFFQNEAMSQMDRLEIQPLSALSIRQPTLSVSQLPMIKTSLMDDTLVIDSLRTALNDIDRGKREDQQKVKDAQDARTSALRHEGAGKLLENDATLDAALEIDPNNENAKFLKNIQSIDQNLYQQLGELGLSTGALSAEKLAELPLDQGINLATVKMISSLETGAEIGTYQASADLQKLTESLKQFQETGRIQPEDSALLNQFGLAYRDGQLIGLLDRQAVSAEQVQQLLSLSATLQSPQFQNPVSANANTRTALLINMNQAIRTQLTQINQRIADETQKLQADMAALETKADQTETQIEALGTELEKTQQDLNSISGSFDQFKAIVQQRPLDFSRLQQRFPAQLAELGITAQTPPGGEKEFLRNGQPIPATEMLDLITNQFQSQIQNIEVRQSELRDQEAGLNRDLANLNQQLAQLRNREQGLKDLLKEQRELENSLNGSDQDLEALANDPGLSPANRQLIQQERAENQSTLTDTRRIRQGAESTLADCAIVCTRFEKRFQRMQKALADIEKAFQNMDRTLSQAKANLLLIDAKLDSTLKDIAQAVAELIAKANELGETLELAPTPETQDLLDEMVKDWQDTIQALNIDLMQQQSDQRNSQSVENRRMAAYTEQMKDLKNYMQDFFADRTTERETQVKTLIMEAIAHAKV